jgi:hypothetical protein
VSAEIDFKVEDLKGDIGLSIGKQGLKFDKLQEMVNE